MNREEEIYALCTACETLNKCLWDYQTGESDKRRDQSESNLYDCEYDDDGELLSDQTRRQNLMTYLWELTNTVNRFMARRQQRFLEALYEVSSNE